MKKTCVISFAAALLLCMALCTAAFAQQRTATGVLEKSAHTEPGSPGWEIRLDEPVVAGSHVLGSVEVYARDEDFSRLEGRRVSVTGSFVEWRTPERGKFIVLEACEVAAAAH